MSKTINLDIPVDMLHFAFNDRRIEASYVVMSATGEPHVYNISIGPTLLKELKNPKRFAEWVTAEAKKDIERSKLTENLHPVMQAAISPFIK